MKFKISNLLSGTHSRDILTVFAIQAFALVASLTISLLITNILGAAAYGAFSYGFSWVNLLAVFSCMGYDQLALKEIPAYRVGERKDWILGYFRYSMKHVLIISITMSAFLFGISFWLQLPSDELLRKGLWLAIPALPIIAIINLRSAWLRSFQFTMLSQLPDKVIRSSVFLAVLLAGYWILKNELNVWMVILFSVGSMFVAFIAGNFFVQTRISPLIKIIHPAYQRLQWTKTAVSLLLVNGMYFYLSQLPVIALGSLRTAEETGIYAIAARLSDLEGYMLFAMNVVLAPIISKLFAEKKLDELQHVITTSLRTGFLFSLAVIICFLFFPGFFLGQNENSVF